MSRIEEPNVEEPIEEPEPHIEQHLIEETVLKNLVRNQVKLKKQVLMGNQSGMQSLFTLENATCNAHCLRVATSSHQRHWYSQ